MKVVDVTVIALFAMLALLIGIEQVRPVRRVQGGVPGWRLKCVAFIPSRPRDLGGDPVPDGGA